MGCLSWPQKKALKIAFNLIGRKIDREQANLHEIPLDQRTLLQNNGEGIKTALVLVGKVLQL